MKKLLLLTLILVPVFSFAQRPFNPSFSIKKTVQDTAVAMFDQNENEIKIPTSIQVNLKQAPLSYNSKIYESGGNAYFIGNSITFGINASSTSKRWTTLLSGFLGVTEINHGVSGSTMEYQYPYNYSGGVAATQRLSDIPTKSINDKLLVIAFGANDIGYTGANYTPDHYFMAGDTVVRNAISKGWNPQDILILSSFWITDSGFNTYHTNYGLPKATPKRFGEFVNSAKNLAYKYGTKFIKIDDVQKLNGDTTQLAVDGVHPLDAGHLIIAKGIYKYLAGVMPGDNIPIHASLDLPLAAGPSNPLMNTLYAPNAVFNSGYTSFTDGTFGVDLGSYSAGGAGAIYLYGTPHTGTNHSLYFGTGVTTINSTADAYGTINGNGIWHINAGGFEVTGKYKLSALNTAPSSSSDTGEVGEIRFTANYIYLCIATNTWVRSAFSTY